MRERKEEILERIGRNLSKIKRHKRWFRKEFLDMRRERWGIPDN
jgi:hypothetical protein